MENKKNRKNNINGSDTPTEIIAEVPFIENSNEKVIYILSKLTSILGFSFFCFYPIRNTEVVFLQILAICLLIGFLLMGFITFSLFFFEVLKIRKKEKETGKYIDSDDFCM